MSQETRARPERPEPSRSRQAMAHCQRSGSIALASVSRLVGILQRLTQQLAGAIVVGHQLFDGQIRIPSQRRLCNAFMLVRYTSRRGAAISRKMTVAAVFVKELTAQTKQCL